MPVTRSPSIVIRACRLIPMLYLFSARHETHGDLTFGLSRFRHVFACSFSFSFVSLIFVLSFLLLLLPPFYSFLSFFFFLSFVCFVLFCFVLVFFLFSFFSVLLLSPFLVSVVLFVVHKKSASGSRIPTLMNAEIMFNSSFTANNFVFLAQFSSNNSLSSFSCGRDLSCQKMRLFKNVIVYF